MVDRWLENLIETNETQMTTLNATFDPLVGTLTTKNMASCTSRHYDFEFSRQCLHKDTKYTFKTTKMDQITLECWYNSFLGLLRADGRGFLHQKPILKKVRQNRNQDAAHAQKRVRVPLSTRADWSRIEVEKKLENILNGSLTTLSSPVKWISYCEWLGPKLAIRK